jgi:cyclohexa-1,5-dienecarbonyl-CoA hydratase
MKNLKIIQEKQKAGIILSKPPLNILNCEDIKNISCLIKSFGQNNSVKIITFESDQKIFSAGIDILEHTEEKIKEMLLCFRELLFQMMELDTPIISIVKSGCVGGGCEIALFCDFVIASENAWFSHPEIKLGCFPPASMAYLSYITGNKKALEIILTGNKISAQEAFTFGLVNKLFKEEEFEEKSSEFMESLTKLSRSVLSTTIKGYKKLNYSELKEKFSIAEKIYLEELMKLEDYSEGMQSFIEKREPKWKNK